jgi:oxepin-CoA hydrolase/3-oxo-5,6-dehydrosuberyl-CoA semialdehyde dehydrogenase
MATKQQTFLYQELPVLIDAIQEDTKPLWGKMGPQHMLEHLSGINYLALGKMPVKLEIAEEKVPKALLWLDSDKMFRRNIRMEALPEEPAPLRFVSLEEAKAKPKATIDRFKAHYDAHPGFEAWHPAFGDLDRGRWEQFLYKHYRHHFGQFGLIDLGEE